jgi:WD40-like Beta Propeller Repeat
MLKTRQAQVIAAAVAVALIIAIVAIIACAGGGGSGATPSPSPSPSPVPTPTPTKPPPGPTQPPPLSSYRLIIREFTPLEDVIWRVNALDPAAREELVRIPHREGFGIKPSLSPDGKLLAYLSLPEFALSAQSSQAEAYVMDLETKESVKVTDGIDLTFTPLWSPDGRLLFMRRYAGPEFLAAQVSLLRAKITRKEDPTPTPTPRPTPTVPLPPEATPPTPAPTPTPTPDPLQVVIQDTVAHVLSFTPIGFADDGRSMFFVQVQGGTGAGGGSLVAMIAPSTTESIAEFQAAVDADWAAVQEANKRAADEAIAAGQPTPSITITPRPTPTRDARAIVDLSQQVAFDYELSPDLHRVSYLDQQFVDGEILNRTMIADLVAATTAPLAHRGLSGGHHLRPAWHPDGRLSIGILPADGQGLLALVAIDGSSVTLLPQAEGGFDTPRSWAPDGSWLAVTHNGGNSLANPGPARLDLVSPSGQRVTVIEGADNSNEDSVISWVNIAPPPSP